MSYPPLSISPNQSRAALLANLRTSPSPNHMYGNNGSQGGYPAQHDGSRRASATSTSGGSSAGPRLPPHVPQRQQRYPSSEHTLGPSFDDDDEDEEMVAKMAALNAGVYPFGAGARSGRASAGGVAGNQPQQQQQTQQHQQQSYAGGGGSLDRGQGVPYPQQQLDRQLQERQQQELLRVALQLAQQQGGHHQQNGRGMSELQILQALQAQQQQREVEAQMEQLLKIQQAQNLQQQLIAQARQAALLAEQPYGNPPSRGYSNSPSNGGGGSGRYDPAAAYAQQSHAQAQAQALYQAQLRAHAQQQQQANPQQLASAYEQRHAAQQQIQANLRARSAGGGVAPPLPPPGGNGPRFGFESSDVNELAAQLGRTTMAGGGGNAYPSDPRAGDLQSGHLSPAGSDRFAGSGVPRMASPLSAMHQPSGVFGGRSDSPNAGPQQPQQQQQQRDVRAGRQDELPPPHQVSAASSIWGGSQTSNNAGPTSPWQHNAEPAGSLAQQQQQLANGRPHSSNGSSRFAFAQQQQPQQQQLFDARSHSAAPLDPHAELRSPASSDRGGGRSAPNANARNVAASADALRPMYEGLGMGRPAPNSAAAASIDRTQSMSAAAQFLSAGGRSRDASPGPPLQRITSDPYGRQPASQQQVQQVAAPASSGTVTVLRQPIGPPSVPDELGSRNFASRIRKQAGSNLSLLGRREGSVPPV